MIPADKAYEAALSNAVEGDAGLYELVWEFNARYPAEAPEERLRAAQAAVSRLIAEGYATVSATVWLSDALRELSPEDAARVVSDADSFRSPADTPDGSFFCYSSTPLGEAAYFARPPK